MKILVNGKQAVMKEGSSFEYHSENPLFTEAEDYSFDIEFPMKDCPQNILIFGALHVKGVDISTVSFPCEIITDSFDKTGILTITEVGSEVVKGQFLEGMSQQNFASALPSTYITDIDFSDYDGSDGTQTSMDRVEGTGWANMVVWDNKRERAIYYQEEIMNFGGWSCRHIYLYHLIALVAQKCGFSVDDAVLRTVPMYTKIVVANTVYQKYSTHGVDAYPSLARSLPQWTVREFFDEVGKFFGCIVEIDSVSNRVIFKSYKQLSSVAVDKVSLSVNDDFEVEVVDDSDKKYKGNIRYKIADDSDPDKVNTAGWIYPRTYLYGIVSKTLQEFKGLVQAAAWSSASSIFEVLVKSSIYRITDKNVDVVLSNFKEYNSEGYDPDVSGHPEYVFCEYEPIGLYGSQGDGDELGITPCVLKMKRIWNKPSIDGNPGTTRASTYAYRMPVVDIPQDWEVECFNNDNAPVDEIFEVIKGGEKEEKEYYKKLWVVLHSGTMDQRGHYLNTRKFEPGEDADYASFFKSEYDGGDYPNYNCELTEHAYNLCPSDPSIQALSELPNVDETKLYRYKFLSKTLPDPKAIYVIKGKDYACLRLTAHFTVDGMSELIEGEFYEIVG